MGVNFDLDQTLAQLGQLPKAVRMGAVGAILVGVLAGFYFLSYKNKIE